MLEFIVFILSLFYKLTVLHGNLHARYIDMNLLDDVIAIGSVMLVSFWTLWLPRRGRIIALIVLDVLLSLLIFADLVYYRYFGDFITVPVLLQAGQVGELGGSIRELLRLSDLRLAADFLLVFVVWAGMKLFKGSRKRRFSNYEAMPALRNAETRGTAIRMSGTGRRRTARSRLLSGIIAFVLGFVLTVGPITFYAKTWAVGLFEGAWWNLSLYNVTGLLGFHYYDVSRYVKENVLGKPKPSPEELDEMKQWFAKAAQARQGNNKTFGAYDGSNVIVVQVEAFMNFMIGKDIHGVEITPNFNKLMENSIYYPNYYHQTGQGRTSDADFTSHVSLHPLPSGSVFTRFSNHTFDSLPQILAGQGYDTAAFHAYEGSFWNRTRMYEAMGYDHFYTKKDYTLDEPIGWSLGDKSFFKQSLEFMDDQQQPFYSFLITLSSHHPYTLPDSAKDFDSGEFSGTIFGSYLESIHYTDAALGQLVEGLKARGLWENTILYVYGDHDNSLTDRSDYEQFLGKPLTELDMHQILNQVPLLIHLPDETLTGIDDRASGQLDMAPSLLHLLGIDSSSYPMMGNNLFTDSVDASPLVVLRSGAFTDGKLYYIPSPDHQYDNGSCYDLSTRSKTNIEACRLPHEEAQKRLLLSDKVVELDLIPLLRNEADSPN